MGPYGPIRDLCAFHPVLSGELYEGGRRCSVFPLVDGRSGSRDGVVVESIFILFVGRRVGVAIKRDRVTPNIAFYRRWGRGDWGFGPNNDGEGFFFGWGGLLQFYVDALSREASDTSLLSPISGLAWHPGLGGYRPSLRGDFIGHLGVSFSDEDRDGFSGILVVSRGCFLDMRLIQTPSQVVDHISGCDLSQFFCLHGFLSSARHPCSVGGSRGNAGTLLLFCGA